MNRIIPKLHWQLLPLMLLVLFTSCSKEIEKFSAEKPYAIELTRVRSYFQATSILDRLTEMKVRAYAVTLRDTGESSNQWFVILSEAEADSQKVKIAIDTLESRYSLTGLKMVDYLSIQDFEIIEEVDQSNEVEKIATETPDLPGNVYDVVRKFPQTNMFNVEKAFIFNFPSDQIPYRKYRSYNNTKLDLPRGISKREVARQASAMAEVIFKDNLYQDQVTIEILKLKKGHKLDEVPRAILTQNSPNQPPVKADNIAWFYAAQILNTGRYIQEVFEKITVEAASPLYGYKVLIEPRKGYVRTYFILVDEAGEYVYFSQSTDKTDEEILGYLAGIGKGEGMFANNEFHNSFFTLPECLGYGDVFLGQNSRLLGWDYARSKGYRNWAKAMVGHTESYMDFYNTDLKRSWSYAAFDILTPEKRSFIYNDMYAKETGGNKESVSVGNQSGFFVRVPFIGMNEINYPNGRYIMAIDGNMSKSKLMERALRFQSGEVLTEEDLCSEYRVVFYAYPPGTKYQKTNGEDAKSAPGHIFVGFYKNNKAIRVRGFSPKGYFDFQSSKLSEEDFLVPASKINFSAKVSKELFDKAINIEKDGYFLGLNDCVSYAADVAEEIGLNTPGTLDGVVSPMGYVRYLRDNNKNLEQPLQ
ncbi:MAG: hypothetical protein MRZ79_19500 [Bacteroidia bacterium]|nr:hypothetical protein [Bacteroidia bacterium]